MRVAAAVVLAIVVGFWGLAGLMSDLGPGESWASRWLFLGGVFGVGGLLVGLVAGRSWGIAALCAWPPALGLLVGAYSWLAGPAAGTGGPLDRERLNHLVFALILSLLGGRLSRLLRRGSSRARAGGAGA